MSTVDGNSAYADRIARASGPGSGLEEAEFRAQLGLDADLWPARGDGDYRGLPDGGDAFDRFAIAANGDRPGDERVIAAGRAM